MSSAALPLAGLGAAALLLLFAASGGPPAVAAVVADLSGRAGRFFTWAELTASRTAARLGLVNTPTQEATAALQRLVTDLLDPLRDLLGRPIRITSGYRSPAVNEALRPRSSERSQHMKGEAVDFKVPGLPSRDVVAVIARSGLPFDQAIWYDPDRGGHVHLSYTTRRPNRGEVLHAPASGGFRPWSVPRSA